MKKLALDVGDKTIGVAVSDALNITAQGVTIGLPKKLDGTDSPQTEKVYEFRTMLENKMRSSGMGNVAIKFYDERLTTVMAEKVLIDADVSRNIL